MRYQPTPFQSSIFAVGPTGVDSEFVGAEYDQLSAGAWAEYVPHWLGGHEAIFDALVDSIDWHAYRREMYDRVVDIPRLTGSSPRLGLAPEPLLDEMAETLSRRYRRDLTSVSFALYRDGRDSVAMHGDKMGRLRRDCVVAIVSVGAPRRFLLREVNGSGARTYELGWGDLLVMGGDCQTTWRHGVPKARHAEPRISIMFRQSLTALADLGSPARGR